MKPKDAVEAGAGCLIMIAALSVVAAMVGVAVWIWKHALST